MAVEKKQSTACTIQLGPFVDKTSGDTEETALNLQPGDIFLSKNGGVFAAKTNADTCDADTKGWYRCNLGETDMNTLGELLVATHESGALYVWREIEVVRADYYDSKYGTDYLQVDVVQVKGDDADTAIATSASLSTSLFGDTIEGGITFAEMLRGIAAAVMGKSSGGGTTTSTFRDLADTKDRIVATVDASGNRTAVTRTLT